MLAYAKFAIKYFFLMKAFTHPYFYMNKVLDKLEKDLIEENRNQLMQLKRKYEQVYLLKVSRIILIYKTIKKNLQISRIQ